ncbi:CitMHS family transporter [Sphingopyxis sp. 113P3]|uniref:CitMHS family transporter n=1 Tax=Sphingopyxis sp. (strain 113P3) TaxID=292913 RepID=UPI0006AD4CCA|nr:citrate:proton symporter [Sphingopyxis sp. 113P3]ALC11160.1 citrate transporter [Sphingopyxis sp. 113P3]
MLALAGLLTILLVLTTIMKKWLSPFVALAAIPLAAALLLGQGQVAGGFMLQGLAAVAPMAAMFLFAILFFSILSHAGLFRPLVGLVIRATRDDPRRVALGTALLTSIVHLDGAGAATFLIVIPPLVPIYDRLGLDRRMLAGIVAMAAGVGNILPWGGPTLRASTALKLPVMTFFAPLIPVYLVGLLTMFAFAWWMGARQLRSPSGIATHTTIDEEHASVPLDGRYALNMLMVVAVLGAMLTSLLHPAIAFMLGTIMALMVNLRGPAAQTAALEAHAPAAMSMVAILIAAGCFTGILRGTGMLDAMAHAGAGLLPASIAGQLPLLTGLTSMPLSLVFDPDSFYFGVLPVLAGVANASGVPAVDVGRAAVLGQMTTGFPVSPLTPSTFLLVGLARIGLADHQRFTIPYLFALSVVMTFAAVAFGVFAP